MQNQQWQDYPMGPKLRDFLQAGPGHPDSKAFEPEIKNAFGAQFLAQSKALRPDEEQLTDLLDELLTMDMPHYVLKAIDQHPDIWLRASFRGANIEGIASLLVAELERAKECFYLAQEIMPLEPGPYVNLSQIFQHEGLWEESYEWLKAGLEVDKNHFPSWELVAKYFHQVSAEPLSALRELAEKLDSWVGFSLLLELDPVRDAIKKVEIFSRYYQKGLRSDEFLIDYTAALGMAGDYTKIGPVAWELEQVMQKPVPWKLRIHELQAILAMGEKEAFIKEAKAKIVQKIFPGRIEEELKAMIDEVELELKEEKPAGGCH